MKTETSARPAPGFAEHPEHRIEIARAAGRVRAALGDKVVADSRHALVLHERGYDPVTYFPRADVRLGLMWRTDHRTYCPFKGHAAYWSLGVGAGTAENVAWSYQEPYREVTEIEGHIAFYGDKVAVAPA